MANFGSIITQKISENDFALKWTINNCVLSDSYYQILKSPKFFPMCNNILSNSYFTLSVERYKFGDSRNQDIRVYLEISNELKRSKKRINCKACFLSWNRQSVFSSFAKSSVQILSVNRCLIQNELNIICSLRISDVSGTDDEEEGKFGFFRNSLNFFRSLRNHFSCNARNAYRASTETIPGRTGQTNTMDQNMSLQNEANKMACASSDVRPAKVPKNPNYLTQDLRHLFIKGIMSDLTIRIDDEHIPVHRLILSARSPVFKKMFENDTSNFDNIIMIDCNAQLFHTFLLYLYTDELEVETIEDSMALYILGYEYDVEGLKISCSEKMQFELCSGDIDYLAYFVCDILKLAHLHDDQNLKNEASKFIVEHFAIVGTAKKWKEMLRNDSELTSEVLLHLTSNLQNHV